MVSQLASGLREANLRTLKRLTPAARIELARQLGDAAAALYARVHGVGVDEAARVFSGHRQAGRRPSRSAGR
jgi:hypothetical protein